MFWKRAQLAAQSSHLPVRGGRVLGAGDTWGCSSAQDDEADRGAQCRSDTVHSRSRSPAQTPKALVTLVMPGESWQIALSYPEAVVRNPNLWPS